MAINIVVLDYGGLPADADFPPLRATRYRWEQYPSTPAALIAERGARAHVLVTLNTPRLNRRSMPSTSSGSS